MNLLSWKTGKMQGAFSSVKKLFKIDQFVFELVLGSDSLLEIFGKYSCFEVSTNVPTTGIWKVVK